MGSSRTPPSRRTRVPVRTARRAAPDSGPRLVCTLGPAEGQEFELTADEVVIGRSSANAISVADTSMSRKHARLRKDDDGAWAVSDLGSGNGTTVNGDEIFEERLLANNDVIAMGDSEFAFIDTVATAALIEPVRRPPVRTARNANLAVRERPRRTRRDDLVEKTPKGLRTLLIRFGGVVAIVMALAVGWKAIDNKKKQQAMKLHQLERAHHDEMDAAFQDAKRLIHDGKWAEAQDALKQLQVDDPDYEVQSVQQYIDRAQLELPNQAALAEASTAIDAGEVGRAAAALARVQNALGPTETSRAALAERLDARLVARRAEAREMLATPGDVAKMAAIKVIADDLLTARPDDREAIEIKRQADAAIARLHSPNAAAVVVETPWVDVQSRFRTGDASGALTLAQACAPKAAQCRTLESELKEFDSKFKSLEQLPELELFSLFELDRKIAGGQSSDLSKPIRTRVAAAFYLKASQSKTTGNWSKAIENARRVLQADSAHAGALNLLSEARNQAKEVYLRGYQLKDSTPDEAARLFKEVIAMTPKDDEYHQKADARLAEIQKQ